MERRLVSGTNKIRLPGLEKTQAKVSQKKLVNSISPLIKISENVFNPANHFAGEAFQKFGTNRLKNEQVFLDDNGNLYFTDIGIKLSPRCN